MVLAMIVLPGGYIATLVASNRGTNLVWRRNEENIYCIPQKGCNEETWDGNQLPQGFKEFLNTTDKQLPKKEEFTPPPLHQFMIGVIAKVRSDTLFQSGIVARSSQKSANHCTSTSS
jgi:hypothetical protein